MQYQQRAIELARLRRVAIEEAHRDRGMSFTEIAKALGVSKGRITQIKSGAPSAERAFFGVGPVAVGVPLRNGMDDRKRDYIDAADAGAQGQVEAALAAHSLASNRFSIGTDMIEPPAGDVVVICGPKSAPIGANLLASDPHLGMVRDGGRWWLEDRRARQRYGSPARDQPPEPGDVAYLGRHREGDRVIVHIAGICSFGSLGMAHYLDANLSELWSEMGDASFSMAVRCRYDGVEITSVERLAGPYRW